MSLRLARRATRSNGERRAKLLERKNNEALTVARGRTLLEAMRRTLPRSMPRTASCTPGDHDALVFGFAIRWGLPQMVAKGRRVEEGQHSSATLTPGASAP